MKPKHRGDGAWGPEGGQVNFVEKDDPMAGMAI